MMLYSGRWIATIAIAFAVGIEPLLLTREIAMSTESPILSPTGMTKSVIGLRQPLVLLALSKGRKNRVNQSALENAKNLELEGRIVADECIIQENQRSCDRLGIIESSLQNLCQSNTSVCYYYRIFMSNQGNLRVSKALLDSAR